LEQAHLAKQKDIVAMAPDRDTALELKQNIIDEIDFYDHNQTGRLENSIGVRKVGDEYGVTAVDYAKYVNGRDRENDGQGFIDAAVQQTIIDTGEDVILLV
jgi:hypothetical protein